MTSPPTGTAQAPGSGAPATPIGAAQTGDPSDRAPLRLVRGDATAEEVAAVMAVLTAVSAGAPEPAAPRHTSEWAARERALRRPLSPGPGAWRASAWAR